MNAQKEISLVHQKKPRMQLMTAREVLPLIAYHPQIPPACSPISRGPDSPLIVTDVINLPVVGSELTAGKAHQQSITTDRVVFSSDLFFAELV
jgi:hypothetical protein